MEGFEADNLYSVRSGHSDYHPNVMAALFDRHLLVGAIEGAAHRQGRRP